MADVRIPPQSAIAAQLGRAPPLARSEAVRAAQRAFFQAALNQSQDAAPVAAPARPTSDMNVKSASALAGEANRFARPGSLLDIKV